MHDTSIRRVFGYYPNGAPLASAVRVFANTTEADISIVPQLPAAPRVWHGADDALA